MMAVALFALLLVGYFTRDQWMALFQKGEVVPSNTNPGANNQPTTSVDKTRILKRGDRGASVKELQRLLNEKHRNNLPQNTPLLVEDGIFGSKTEQMLFKWTGKTSISIQQLILQLTKP